MSTTQNDEMQAWTASLNAPYDPPTTQPQPAPLSSTPCRDNYLARLTPLPERLRVALAKFPTDMTADGLHMSQMWPLVTGVQRSKPRAFEVAAALREIGWTRVRFYSDSGPSQTAWFPPEIDVAEAKAILKARKV